ncbi:phosphocholine cytidylyltransferase family protein [Legionella septentrionalis]|uniref:Phosphocholine cytidylyltransferase family protein n=1 Tax=Legionella septentrionalis TaxID=2498109 RepID=A0A433JM70_9GAMM|nr:phosphocholine cytidylyltransferase family protein [Legionella septentrionalis]RUQ91057.1 phosphocholine cytidylyltransferase family protein [Legionella septentrionalis]RUR02874.1 phosphocholine cytidylyltransferase family protein [Legionella septentrionalis]RUR11472.1 phosphocholine cytidylyltransferase family protein [Legionella septentrionalis]RUR16737.1 phosphocholine cytidylyltransferase family protein [Legionella septentrionalis]
MLTIILAAGQGTRLRPFTNHQPKCMVPLANKPLLHWQFETLRQCNIDSNIIVVGGYQIENLIAANAKILLNPDYEHTNMVATLFCAREYMKAGMDLLISYGDIVFEPKVLQAVLCSDAPVSIAADKNWRRLWKLRMEDPLTDAETFQMDAENRVIELGKKPNSYDQIKAQYIGLIRIRKDYITRLLNVYDEMDRTALFDGKDFNNMYMTSFLQHLINLNWDVRACLIQNGWLEIDTVEDKNLYEKMVIQGELKSYCDLDRIAATTAV